MKLSNDYYQQNISLLATYHPEAWKVVVDYAGPPLGEFVLSENQKINLLILHRLENSSLVRIRKSIC